MSSINPNNIDGQYPIAGQDNDSQGFRDNFTNIKNNFTFAYNELTDLQSKVVLKGALSGGSLNNDMAYAQLISPQLLKSVETVTNLSSGGSKSGSFTINWADGNFQYFTTGGNCTLGFSGWPTSGYYAKLRLQITTDTTNRTITFPAEVKTTLGLSDIQGAASQVVTLPTASTYVFELTTYDGGTNIAIEDVLRNYDIVTTGSSGTFTSLNVSGNVLAAGGVFSSLTVNGNPTVNGNATIGAVGAISGQFHSVVGNITQTTSGGAVYINTTGNVLAAAVVAGAVTSTGTINTTGNVLAAGAVVNALTVNGTATLAGSIVTTGLQHYYPTANVAITGNVGVSRILVTPTTDPAIVSFFVDVTLPNVTTDGTVLSISSNVAVNELRTLSPWVGTTVSPSANVSLTAGSKAEYLYRSAESKWYKVG